MELITELEKKLDRNNITMEKRIWFDSSLLPKHFNQAINHMIRELYKDYIPMENEKYTINYDANGKMYIDVRGTQDSTRLLIYSIKDIKDSSEEEFGKKVSDKEIYILACYYKFLYEEIQDYIELRKKDIDIREIMENQHNYAAKIIKRTYERLKEANLTILDIKSASNKEEVEKTINDMFDYIKNICDKRKVYIYYKEPESDVVVREKRNDGKGVYNERINDIIPYEEREREILQMGVKYSCDAYSEDTQEVNSYGYLLETKDKIPVLVIEPVSGLAYTRVIYLNEDYELTSEEFGEVCKYYLELSNNEFYYCPGTIRFGHTTKDEFAKNLKLITGMSDNFGYNYDKMKRIKGAYGTRKENKFYSYIPGVARTRKSEENK